MSTLSVQATKLHPFNYTGLEQYLSSLNWPPGLREACIRSCESLPLRYVIADDSSSMLSLDGHRIMTDSRTRKTRCVKCTRWAEVGDVVRFHMEAAIAGRLITELHCINRPPILLGHDNGVNARVVSTILDDRPGGKCNICATIRAVAECIRPMAYQLHAYNEKVAVTILFSGESDDGDILSAIRELAELPVWIVLRLCTGKEDIIKYWTQLDNDLELRVDVLLHWQREALEVLTHNHWLNYGEPLHRLREFGVNINEFDLIDQSELNSEQMLAVCGILLNCPLSDIPHPVLHRAKFEDFIRNVNSAQPLTWHPVSNKLKPWISLKKLHKTYFSDGDCFIM